MITIEESLGIIHKLLVAGFEIKPREAGLLPRHCEAEIYVIDDTKRTRLIASMLSA
jgi:hypothetical protein